MGPELGNKLGGNDHRRAQEKWRSVSREALHLSDEKVDLFGDGASMPPYASRCWSAQRERFKPIGWRRRSSVSSPRATKSCRQIVR